MMLHRRTTHAVYFGTGLDIWLWRQLLPDMDDDTTLAGGGSLERLSLSPGHHAAIAGAGLGSAPIRFLGAQRNWHVYWLRGPLSARRLRLDDEAALTDGAALLPGRLPVKLATRDCAAFIPDAQSAITGAWARCCDIVGIDYVDPRDHWRGIVVRLATARLVLTGTLLGAVIADSYRVPWIPVITAPIDSFPWQDWCASVGLPYRPIALPPSSAAEWLRGLGRTWKTTAMPDTLDRSVRSRYQPSTSGGFAEAARNALCAVAAREPVLSEDETLDRLVERMIGKVDVIAEDCRRGAFRPIVTTVETLPDRDTGAVDPKGVAAWM